MVVQGDAQQVEDLLKPLRLPDVGLARQDASARVVVAEDDSRRAGDDGGLDDPRDVYCAGRYPSACDVFFLQDMAGPVEQNDPALLVVEALVSSSSRVFLNSSPEVRSLETSIPRALRLSLFILILIRMSGPAVRPR